MTKKQKILNEISHYLTVFLVGYVFGTCVGLTMYFNTKLMEITFIEILNDYEFWQMLFRYSVRTAIILILIIITTPKNNGDNSISN
jgi:cytochrome bd-type quinol oxidase subunit 2